MAELGKITEKQRDEAKKEKIKFAPPSLGSIKAPHFSLMVKEYLVNKYGEDIVMNGGLKVITTLDWPMQEIGEKVVEEGASRNELLYGGRTPVWWPKTSKTGQILALVGSKDYLT